MNNQQFRRLLLDSEQAVSRSKCRNESSQEQRDVQPAVFGSRTRASIPMTPRHLGNSGGSGSGSGNKSASKLFANQFKERNAQQNVPSGGISRHSAAPKGSKLATGYKDRAQQLRESLREEGGVTEDREDKASRIKALEEMLKLAQIDQKTFEKLRDEITGGDLANVHLVKGLDRKLLARARAGEDVYNVSTRDQNDSNYVSSAAPDEELDELLQEDVSEVERELRSKRGILPQALQAGRKRTRDDIIREMKEARMGAAPTSGASSPPTQALGKHFKRIADKDHPGTSRIEIDARGREILVIVDEQGNVKRKIRKSKASKSHADSGVSLLPDKNVQPLGNEIEVPALPGQDELEESDDIFSNAGSDYNPLGELADELEDVSEVTDGEDVVKDPEPSFTKIDRKRAPGDSSSADPLRTKTPRNYFGAAEHGTSEASDAGTSLHDPAILAAIKRASSKAGHISIDRDPLSDELTDDSKLGRIRASLAGRDRDADDIDMGFGSSRFDDQEDDEIRPTKLAKWKGAASNDDYDGEVARHKTSNGSSQKKKENKRK